MRKPIQAGTAFVMFLASLIILAFVGVPMLVEHAGDNPTTMPGITVDDTAKKKNNTTGTTDKKTTTVTGQKVVVSAGNFDTFESKEDMMTYLTEARAKVQSYYGVGMGRMAVDAVQFAPDFAVPEMAFDGDVGVAFNQSAVRPERVSDTNVQVIGIDEPDIVKVGGTEIYIAGQQSYYGDPMPLREINIDTVGVGDAYYPYPEYRAETEVVKVFPPEDMESLGSIEDSGNLLLDGDTLIVISDRQLAAYDVSEASKPEEIWDISIEDNTSYHSARLIDSSLYLITQTYLNAYDPCPYVPLRVGSTELTIRCTDIHRPDSYLASEVTYTVARIDTKSGTIHNDISFLGSWNATVYMSSDALYVTYPEEGDMLEFLFGFVLESNDLFPAAIVKRIETLRTYDISQSAKMMELEQAFSEWERGLDADDRLRVENEMENRMTDYFDRHKRELNSTQIVKISSKNLSVAATGAVPGTLLNQFSLDEYKGNLRVAVTVGEGWFGMVGSGESANDVYVLDPKLNVLGSIQDLGLTERVYSARFIGDVGYVVTFRQTDPFYVLDLSDPRNPEMTGELKIPGYSSYLHPIDADTVVGIGKEGSRVKVSLFDVSDPTNPREADKYELSEYWSDVLNTHHAFLHDAKHGVFFMPGSKGGYIFSYEGAKLKMVKAVGNVNALRAVYLDDYMYIIGRDAIVVLDEADWERVGELKLR